MPDFKPEALRTAHLGDAANSLPVSPGANRMPASYFPPYIIPEGLRYTPFEIKNVLDNGRVAQQEAMMKYLADNDDFYFVKKVLRYDKCWESVHRPIVERAFRPVYQNTLELLPRGIFKTTIRTISRCIRLIYNNPDISILIVMNSATNAQKVLSEIKTQLKTNRRLMAMYGDLMTGAPRDQDKSIIINARVNSSRKEGTIDAIGKDTSITSMHYDVILLDDIADIKDRESEAERNKTVKVYQDVQDLRMDDRTPVHMTGTRWHHDDVYKYVMDDVNPEMIEGGFEPYDVTVVPVQNDEGDLLFPDIFDEDVIQKLIIQKGIVSFSAQYLLKPIPPGTQLFDSTNCQYFDMAFFDENDGDPYGYFDPALGKNKNACMAPIITAWYMHSGPYMGKILIVGADMAVRVPSKSVAAVVNYHVKYNYTVFGVEDNGEQVHYINDIDGAARTLSLKQDTKVLVPLIGITNTSNKDARIERFETFYTSGKLMFRKDWKVAPSNYKELLFQLWNYPAATYKDGPDALEALINRVILGSSLHIGSA